MSSLHVKTLCVPGGRFLVIEEPPAESSYLLKPEENPIHGCTRHILDLEAEIERKQRQQALLRRAQHQLRKESDAR